VLVLIPGGRCAMGPRARIRPDPTTTPCTRGRTAR
jgi:hypothetical protein